MDREDSKLSSSSAEEAISSDEDDQKTTGDRAPDAAGLILATAQAAGAPITPKDLAQRAKHAADLFGSVEDWGDVTRTLTACGALQPFTRPPPQTQPLPPAKQARLEEDGARLYHASRVAPFHARAFDLARDGRFEELEAACGSAAATTLKAWCFHMSPKWATLRRKRLRRLDARGLRTARVALLACQPGLELDEDLSETEPSSPLSRAAAQLGLGPWAAPPQASAAEEWREETRRRRAGGLSSDGAACDGDARARVAPAPPSLLKASGSAPRLAAAARAVAALARARAKLATARDRDAMARTAFIDAGAEGAISRPPGTTYARPPPQKKRPSSSSSKKKKKKGRLDPPPPPPTEDDLALRARLVEAAAKPTPPSAELAAAAPAPAASAGAPPPPPVQLEKLGPAPRLRDGDDASALATRASAGDAPLYRPSRRPPAPADARRLLHDLAPATFDAGRRGAMAPPPGGADADAAAWRRVSALVEGAAAVAAARRVGGAWSPAASPHGNAALSPRGRRGHAPSPPPLNLPGLALPAVPPPSPRDLPAPDAARLNAPYGGPGAGAGKRAREAAAAARARGDHDDAAALSRNAVVLAEMKRDIDALLAEAQVAPPPQ